MQNFRAILPLEKVSENSPRYILSIYRVVDPEIYGIMDLIHLQDLIFEYLLEESDHSIILGHIVSHFYSF